MKKKIWLPVAFALLASCSSSKKEAVVSPYLNLEQMADSQVAYLSKINPKVQKKVIANGQSEIKSVQISDWSKELDIIKKANLDKPAFVGNYAVDITSI